MQQTVKDEIITELSENLSVMSIDLEFADVETTLLEVQTFFNLDPDLTSSTAKAVEENVQATINNFFSANLQKFGKVFRRSNILSVIDDLDTAILNSRMEIKMQRSFTPTAGTSLSYTINFPAIIASADDTLHVITTTNFTFKVSPKIGSTNFSTTINDTIKSAIPTMKTAQKDDRII